MSLRALAIATAFALGLGLLQGCEEEKKDAFGDDGNIEKKPLSTLPADATKGISAVDTSMTDASEAAKVTYLVSVYAKSGARMCKGNIDLTIMSNFSINLPDAKLQCGSLSIDLGKVLNNSDFTKSVGADGNVSHDGTIFYVKELSGATFDPPRPFLLGPVVQNIEKYKNFTHSSSHTATAVDDTGQQRSGQGRFDIKVLEMNGTYKNEFITTPFTKILKWEVSKTGFEGVPSKYGMLFDKMVWYWNTRPIMIPKISIVGSVADFLASGEDPTMINKVVGKVAILLDAKSYTTGE